MRAALTSGAPRAYHQPSVAIHFTWKQDWPAVSRLLPAIEKELSAFKPRPHWAKLFTLAPSELRSRYERLDDFRQLAAKYDPKVNWTSGVDMNKNSPTYGRPKVIDQFRQICRHFLLA